MTPHQKGLLLTGFGGLVLSFDIPVLRLANGDMWSVQFMRYGLGLCVMLLLWAAISLWRRRPVMLLPGRIGILVALLLPAVQSAREAARRMRDGGRIVNVSTSVVGTKMPTYSVYAATKSAVETMTASRMK